MGFIEEQANAWAEIRQLWQDSRVFATPPQTPDGPLATVESTAMLRDWLFEILSRYQVRTMLDAACGDWNWMRLMILDGIAYTGWDVDEGRILRCLQRIRMGDVTGNPHTCFEVNNLLTVQHIGRFDVILCRHFLQHLPTNDLVGLVLAKFKLSASPYLLTTTYPGANNDFEWNPDGYDHAWKGYFERAVDLQAEPFNLAPKLEAFTEAHAPGGVIKAPHELALFRIND